MPSTIQQSALALRRRPAIDRPAFMPSTMRRPALRGPMRPYAARDRASGSVASPNAARPRPSAASPRPSWRMAHVGLVACRSAVSGFGVARPSSRPRRRRSRAQGPKPDRVRRRNRFGRIAGRQESPREGPESVPRQPFRRESEIGFSQRCRNRCFPRRPRDLC